MTNIKTCVLITFLMLVTQASQAQQIYPEDGWWWDANASGRGYMLERQGDLVFMTAFHYSGIGEPEWLSIQGTYIPSTETTGDIGELDGVVIKSFDGQVIGGEYIAPVTSSSEQNPLTLTFQTNQTATLSWPNEIIELTRTFWSYQNSLDQVAGKWLLTVVEPNQNPLVRFATITSDGIQALIHDNENNEIGLISTDNETLSLSMTDLSGNIDLIVPETKRFYAGSRDGESSMVFGLRIDDLPAVFIENVTQLMYSTDSVLCEYSDTTPNNQASVSITSVSQWTCDDGERLLTANGIPDHEVGTFPNPANPNTISEQTIAAALTLEPIQTDTPTTLGGPAGTLAYILNGIKVDAGTGGSCNDSGDTCDLAMNVGSWSIEALGQSSFNFGTDDNNAHVQPNGEYHYHGIPEGFVEKRGGNGDTVTLIGWAADGFPIYARYGYSIADDASSEVVAMTGSYQLVNVVSDTRPDTDLYALGTFSQDWEYVAGSGDLDECNGRVGVTPEFPEGIYHYYATDTYPYFQRCVKGEVEGAGGPPGGGPAGSL